MFRYSLLLTLLTLLTGLYGQDIDTAFFQQKELELVNAYQQISTAEPTLQSKAAQQFANLLYKTVHHPGSWDYPFIKLDKLGRIKSDNNQLILYTWNLQDRFGFNTYYCIVQAFTKNGKEFKTTKLVQDASPMQDESRAMSMPDTWRGSLYYNIVTTKYKGEYYYTLFGYDFAGFQSNKKIIDIIRIDDRLEIEFVPSMFYYDGKIVNRVVFEFAENAKMMLNYQPDEEMIVFDHLSPSRESLKGQYQFYGPDFSYDGLLFENGRWEHQSDIDVRF